MNKQVQNDWVLVKPLVPDEKSEGGLHTTNSGADLPITATVIYCGVEAQEKGFSVGATVKFPFNAGYKDLIDDIEHRWLHAAEIFAII